MFGLRSRREARAAEAARRAERRAIFAELARRPDHVCPFLGLAYERTGYVDGPSIEHRCFALDEPAPLSSEQQTRVCQQRGHGQCPRYLRGLLATSSEELAALRDAGREDVAPNAADRRASSSGRRRRRRLVLLVALLVLLAAVVAGALYLRVLPL